ncbi:MAG TPA: DUF4282 domain-containing protein [Planctomycetota bacterium]|nr:DUF4282 domain-containing protein [Planctomycetota bacterium]
MEDYLKFRKMITPVLIQVIFWLGIVMIVIASIGAMIQIGVLLGLPVLIFAPIFWRVQCELIIVVFRILDELVRIRMQGEEKTSP